MSRRTTGILIAVILAVLSFGIGRYRYVNRHSATISNPFDTTETATVSNPFMDKDLFGDWVKDQLAFAVILPVIFLAGGAVWAFKR